MGTETAPAASPISGTSPKLRLEARMAVQHAFALLESLKALSGQNVDLDASSVVSISTPCLQILLAAGAEWRDVGYRLRITDPSTNFLMALDYFGISLDALQSQGNPTCH
jgi:anti-anti-sigma regulatory factor